MRKLNFNRTDFWKQGYQACLQALAEIHEICRREKEKLVLECQVMIAALTLEGQRLSYVEELIVKSLNAGGGEPPIQTVQAEYRKGLFSLFLTCPLLATSYSLVNWSLRPFEMGWVTLLVAFGASVVVTVSFERALNLLANLLPDRPFLIWKLFLTVAAGVLGAVAVVYLALMRNDLAHVYMLHQQGTPGFDDAVSRFYQKSLSILRMVFPLLTISLDLVAAVTLHNALSSLTSYGPTLKLLRRLDSVRCGMVRIAGEIKEFETLPERFERDFLNGVAVAKEELRKKELEEAKRARPRDLSPDEIEQKKVRTLSFALIGFILLLVLLIIAARAFGSEMSVVFKDLSCSMNVTDYRGVSEFQKDSESIGEIIKKAKPGTDIKVFGIHENTFGRICLLFEGKVRAENPGFFGQNVRKEVNSMLAEWEKTAKTMRPTARETDIFGALFLAESVFAASKADKKTLTFFSDMRHATSSLNLEKPEVVDPYLVAAAKRIYGIPNLKNVRVHAYGVHGYGKSQGYYNSLKRFWEEILKQTGCQLKAYSPLREVSYE
jgi:Ca2+/Na+ antiporter